ncbi:hypothetical protein [Alicyclobacillus fastidiosus]|uniref:hypothetical protein n=1 Tax=Alicyclobacillus fastidiosus TaxID=392011 RepID=UPI0023EA3E72|nr:hypothetical protein [Alicyclobacillus fastidiosus]GMA66090.1 hypothetical protein GCM10025859_65320 [Alicyclobacillus fastidiosus]
MFRLEGAEADEFIESVVLNGTVELEAHGKRYVLRLLDVKDEGDFDRDENNRELAKRLLELNPHVKQAVDQSREEYLRGEYFTTDDLIRDIDDGDL